MDDYLLIDNNMVIEEDKLEWMKAHKDVCKVINQKESLLKHKARLSWLQHGDKNSKFFHSMMNSRIRINTINSLPTSQGRVDSFVDVKEVARKFFETRFTESDRCKLGL